MVQHLSNLQCIMYDPLTLTQHEKTTVQSGQGSIQCQKGNKFGEPSFWRAEHSTQEWVP